MLKRSNRRSQIPFDENMCARFAYRGEQWPELVEDLQKPAIQPNFNIAPTNNTPAIHLNGDESQYYVNAMGSMAFME